MKFKRKEIKNKFAQHAPKEYWGDDLDVRYHLVSELRKFKNKYILEIGCGAGIILSEMDRSNKIFGIDKDLQSLNIAKQLNPADYFIKGDIDTLPFIKEFFDIVILAAVIEYSVNKNDLLKQISKVLKRDGMLFITTNNKQYSYYINQTALLSYDQIVTLLKPYFTFRISGYNPIPPLLFFMPKKLKAKINRRYQLMIPSNWLSKIPFFDAILRMLMNVSWLRKVSKGFYIEAWKIQ